MQIELRDSASLKPTELDEFSQLLHTVGRRIADEQLDEQVDQFALAVVARHDDGPLRGLMLGSLERVGGTPTILWGLGAARRGRDSGGCLRAMTAELSRRAAISFPDEDVLVGALISQPSAYVLLQRFANPVPRPEHTPNGEDRAWARRLAKRFGVETNVDDRTFRVTACGRRPRTMPVLDATGARASGGSKVGNLVGDLDASQGRAMIAFGWAMAESLAAGRYTD